MGQVQGVGRHGGGGSGEDKYQKGLGPRLLKLGLTLRAKTQLYRFKERQGNGQVSILGQWLWPMREEEVRGGQLQGDQRGVCCKVGGRML